MGVKESAKKSKIELMHRVISSQIMMTDDVEELTLFAVVLLMAAKQILLSNHGLEKTKALLRKYLIEVAELE